MQPTAPAILIILATAPAATAQPCLLTSHAPSPFFAPAVYHAGLQKVLVIDTGSSSRPAQIWSWDGSAWTLIHSGGLFPRQSAPLAYDSARDRLVVYGGWSSSLGYLSATWEWDRTSWIPIQTSSLQPPARAGHGMVYDEQRQRTVLYGGYNQSGPFGDTWEWDGENWARVAASGPSAAYAGISMAYDPLRARVLLYKNTSAQQELWEWDGLTWSQYAGNIPHVSGSTSIAFDRARARLIVAGDGIWEFDPAAGQSLLRQPILQIPGYAAYDAARSLTVFPYPSQTLEYDGAASAASPYIVTQPQSTGPVFFGATIALSTQAGGAAPLTYQWRRDGAALTDGGRVSGTHSPSLTITQAAFPDGGSYDVLVSGACGSVASSSVGIAVVRECYANCDLSTTPPILNVNDFVCFLNAFAARDPYANCDQSSIPPILNVNDFICFQVKFAQGCP